MHTCTECGHEYSVDFAFCTGCGAVNPLRAQSALPSEKAQALGGIGRLEDSEPIDISFGDERTSEPAQAESLVTFHSDEEQLAALELRLSKLEIEGEKLTADLKERQDFLESLEKWEQKNSSSFLFKVFQKMKFNLSEASSLLQRYAMIVDNLSIPDPGVMKNLRKTFHKTLLWSYTVVPLIALFLIYLPNIMARITGAPGLKRVIQNFYFSNWVIITWALVALFLLTWNALIFYYRGWSRFQATVNRTSFDLENVSSGAAHVRGEEARLKTLYPQVKEWLEIMGRSLNRPWLVRPQWYEASQGTITRDSLPNSLRIAQAVEDESPSMLAMQRYAAESFMAKGWRARVFAEQIEIIREAKGLPKERLGVEQLDQDIAYSPNGPRAIVASLIGDESILETVARKQIQPLALEIQRETSGNTRPDIRELATQKTQVVLGGGSDKGQDLKPWDDFLSLSIGDAGKPTVPLSLASLSSEGQRANHHSRAKSFFIAPARFQSLTDVPSSQIRTYAETERMPMDIVVRLDLIGPVLSHELSILEGAERERLVKQSEVEKEVAKKLKDRKSGIN
jgi:hypothetical protein